ncbi:hypothetical protein ROTAS13_04709 [Roseomonas sp. TAS13]|jgi:hypothetical protein|uniref:DUF5983 family protein n=1 Tax=Roseomonas sp. TAS13 TaxID=1926319 RepID=UPI000959C33A|nr:hypothetical protein [Roseomonas sp. TAS13]GAV37019.1 hypothetical protein ROTAS13_04709 [Roseomonas sp. TAS13]
MNPVRRFLDLSTVHLAPEDHACLTASALAGVRGEVCCGTMPYGWFVYADEDRPDISDTLWALMMEARARGCDYLLFDADAQPLTGFPCFDREEPPASAWSTDVIAAPMIDLPRE